MKVRSWGWLQFVTRNCHNDNRHNEIRIGYKFSESALLIEPDMKRNIDRRIIVILDRYFRHSPKKIRLSIAHPNHHPTATTIPSPMARQRASVRMYGKRERMRVIWLPRGRDDR